MVCLSIGINEIDPRPVAHCLRVLFLPVVLLFYTTKQTLFHFWVSFGLDNGIDWLVETSSLIYGFVFESNFDCTQW